MLNFDIYSIYTDDNERNGSNKEFFLTLTEAIENRFNYSNWYRPKGDVWIHLYKGNSKFVCSHKWHILPDGTIDIEYPRHFKEP